MKRRDFNRLLMASLLGTTADARADVLRWPDEGIWNPCLPVPLPAELARDERLAAAWEGIDARQFRDVHVHLIGTGDNGSGIWVNPNLRSWWHPIQHLQFRFYLNASCADVDGEVDARFAVRLTQLIDAFPPGAKAMLLAFDYHHLRNGNVDLESSPFHTPNDYARRVAQQSPQRFDWIASIHPYRADAVARLNDAINQGAKAVKWLPAAMGIDPSSPRCDTFYETLARRNIPLLTHAGDEHAVSANGAQMLGNPLLLRRPLDHGVKVIVAHCATLGNNVDIDQGPDGPQQSNLHLFARLMNEKRYEKRLFGDIAAITQINRPREELDFIFQHRDWHHRLVYGSDYPLPGVMPVFSLDMFVERRQLAPMEADLLSDVRKHNPMLFDFLLKRWLKIDGIRLPTIVFEAARVFDSGR